jgi:hypothetical protein
MELRKWQRQQSKDFYAAGFDALVKRWDKCISVRGRDVEKHVFFSGSNITFYVLYPCVTYLLTVPRIIYSSTTLRPFVGPWRLFQFRNPVHSR